MVTKVSKNALSERIPQSFTQGFAGTYKISNKSVMPRSCASGRIDSIFTL